MKGKTLLISAMTLIVFLMASSVYAASDNISGVIYANYTQSLDGRTLNSFNLTRMYLTYKESLKDDYGLRFTTDIFRDSTTGRLELFAKYAYLEKQVLAGTKIRVGLIDLPWLGYEEGIWGYRMQSGVLADREGYLTSADLGIGFYGGLPGKLIDYALTYTNGEGYNGAESNNLKSIDCRLTYKPLAPLYISGFVSRGYHGALDQIKNRNIIHLAYKTDKLTIAGEYLGTNDVRGAGSSEVQGIGYSVYATAKALDKWLLVGRLDYLDPDTGTANDNHTRYIIGVGCELAEGICILLDNEQLKYAPGAGINTNTVYLHLEAKY